jgi:hypothetical protein
MPSFFKKMLITGWFCKKVDFWIILCKLLIYDLLMLILWNSLINLHTW